MAKPYVIVHMMTSIDGRIDCDMTAQLAGNSTYYSTLDGLNAPTRVSGRVTAQTEMANGTVDGGDNTPLGKEAFKKNTTADDYEIVTDSKGGLRWGNDSNSSHPHLILTSQDVARGYLDYLDQQGISWIATGHDHVDIKRAMDILASEFGVQRLAVVGGGRINGAFLAAGVVDEISLVIGPGVDGRTGQPSVFDGLQGDAPVPLKLDSVKSFDDGSVWLTYDVR